MRGNRGSYYRNGRVHRLLRGRQIYTKALAHLLDGRACHLLLIESSMEAIQSSEQLTHITVQAMY